MGEVAVEHQVIAEQSLHNAEWNDSQALVKSMQCMTTSTHDLLQQTIESLLRAAEPKAVNKRCSVQD